MKVYRITNDVNHYQYFLPQREEDATWAIDLDCTPREEIWTPPLMYIHTPKHKAGDFYQFSSGVLITSPRATEALREFLEMAGELLPLPYEGEVYTVLNVTECINCLDQEATEWRHYDPATGKGSGPKKYVFHPDRFSESPLFKIPETSRAEILVVEGVSELEEEFREVVRQAGLKGLVFEELWSKEE